MSSSASTSSSSTSSLAVKFVNAGVRISGSALYLTNIVILMASSTVSSAVVRPLLPSVTDSVGR